MHNSKQKGQIIYGQQNMSKNDDLPARKNNINPIKWS